MGLGEETLAQLEPEVVKYIGDLETSKRNLEIQYEILQEEYRLALLKRFSRSSEQSLKGQENLFDASELPQTSPESGDTEETITVREHTKKKPGRKPIDPKHPRLEVLHDLAEEEKRCACGHELVRIGEEVTEKVQVIPEQIWIERHVRPKYACHHCEGSGDEDTTGGRIQPWCHRHAAGVRIPQRIVSNRQRPSCGERTSAGNASSA